MEKVNKLKSTFEKYNLDGYLIPKNDEFFGNDFKKDDLFSGNILELFFI